MTTMQDTPLIVPMAIDAFVLTPSGIDGADVDRRATSLDQLIEHAPLGLSPDPVEPDPDYDTGIYLQWELPAALRTGRAAPSTAAAGLERVETGKFPLIPNRWLVVRRAFVTDNTSRQQTLHWLIRADTPVPDESDDTGRTETTPSAKLPGPPSTETGTYPSQDRYGVAYPIDGEYSIPKEPHEWKGSDRPMFLTVNSASLPEFCSYQPYNKNILSFHDLLSDLTSTQEALQAGQKEITVNYLVVGWYSHQASDVLQPGIMKLSETLADMGWDLSDSDNLAITGTVYAGTALGVPWKEDLAPHAYQPLIANAPAFSLDGRPSASEVGLSVGQSSMEACAAAVTRANLLTPEEARIFSAFQHRLLEAPANPGLPDHTREAGTAEHALQYGEHASTFVASQGSRRWRLGRSGSAPLTANQEQTLARAKEKLTTLNAAQLQYDVANGKCQDLITTLKSLWWISMHYTDEGPEKPDADAAAIKTLQEEITRQVNDRKTHLGKVLNAVTQIQEEIGKEKLPYQLQPVPMPPFVQAANPAVVMRNLQARRRTVDYDGYLNDRLPVRRPPTVTGTPLSVYGKLESLLTPPALACVTPLAQEFDMLVGKVVEGVKNPQVNCAKVRGNTGTGLLAGAPTTDPYTRWWNQPWKPAFLEWTANLFPSRLINTPTQSASHPYTLSTTNPTPTRFSPPNPIHQYFHDKATTSTTRRIPESSVRYLSHFATAHPILEDHTRYRLLDAAATARTEESKRAYIALEGKVGKHEWNLTSATLAGVNEACAGRKPDTPLPTRSASLPLSAADDLTYTAPLPEQATTRWFVTPDPAVVTARVPHLPLSEDYYTASRKADKDALGDGDFPPARSGQLSLQELTVHDTFGRLLKLDLRNLQAAEQLFVSDASTSDTRTYTVRGASDAIHGTGLIDLRPRLHQGARLHFDYLTTDPQPKPLSELPEPDAANPVLGWLMVTRTGNRHSLLCYTPQGVPLYDLHCLSAGTPATARPLPGSPYTANPLKDSGFQQNHHELFSFIKPLLASGGGDNGHLAALLSSLDQGLAHTTPPSVSGPDSHGLVLQIGRPVALARARLRLELDGPRLRPPTADALRQALNASGDTTAWPVVLGSPHLYTDGLLGYFIGSDFSVFHTHYPADIVAEQSFRYTKKAEADDITVTAQEPSVAPTGTDVFLLVCPNTSTYATTDILPTSALTLAPTALDAVLSVIQPVIPVGPLLAPPVDASDRDDRVLRTPTPGRDADTPTWTLAELSDPTQALWAYTQASPPKLTDYAPTSVTHAFTGYLTHAPTDFLEELKVGLVLFKNEALDSNEAFRIGVTIRNTGSEADNLQDWNLVLSFPGNVTVETVSEAEKVSVSTDANSQTTLLTVAPPTWQPSLRAAGELTFHVTGRHASGQHPDIIEAKLNNRVWPVRGEMA
ncbi:hypothetical protein [Streptomyces syringium]|uniref:hypothetical protein n=1 Tax=Streptomyces syringium TaxID=76729 RepID=UPI003454B4B1